MSPWSQVWPALYFLAPPVVFAVIFGIFARAPRRAGVWARFGVGVVVGYRVVLLAGSWVAVRVWLDCFDLQTLRVCDGGRILLGLI
jgi:hypothetical protein